MEMRFVRVSDANIYIRKEDVVGYFLELASTAETDVREQLEEAASNIRKVGAQENDFMTSY